MAFKNSISALLDDYVRTIHGGNNARAAACLDVSAPTLLRWRKGQNMSLDVLGPVLDKLRAAVSLPDAQLDEYEFIPKVCARAGAGASLETSDEVQGYYAFRTDFLGRENIHRASSVLLTVTGTSMEPLLKDGDTLLIDKSDTRLRDGYMYVVTLGDELRVKKIFKTVSGIKLHSENPEWADIEVPRAEAESLIVHGRVRWFGRVL